MHGRKEAASRQIRARWRIGEKQGEGEIKGEISRLSLTALKTSWLKLRKKLGHGKREKQKSVRKDFSEKELCLGNQPS